MQFAYGQLVTQVGPSPAQLVQNVLLGPGVTVSNVTFSGSATALGSFTANNTNLGLQSGLVITTGTVLNNGSGPQGPNNQPDAGIDNGAPGSPLLSSQLGGAQTYNAATLEFDFIPYADTVRFRYVFGSEEYPEYVGSQFNDIFGFFISGPGIPGLQNIARIPGNNALVAINNVNNGYGSVPASNPAYYVSNSGGSSIQYDGFTTVLEAVSKVVCGQTYHLRIAITDVGDAIFDSGIFLEANSLKSNTPIEATYDMSYQAFADPSVMAEGCVTTTVNVRRKRNTGVSLTIPITVTGTATFPADYAPNIPTSITFNPGDTLKQFSFSAIQDNITEGIEDIRISFDIFDPCGNFKPIELVVRIADVEDVALSMSDTTVLCPGDPVTIVPSPSGGVGPYTYNWSTGATTPTITVNPLTSTNYSLTITDACLNQSASATMTVNVPVYQPVVAQTSGDITTICPYERDTLSAEGTGGSGIYTYIWYRPNGAIAGYFDTLYVQPSESTLYMVVVTDQCGTKDTAYVNYTILSPPLELSTSPNPIICPGESVDISVTPSGGFGNYYYSWPHSGETDSLVTVNPYFSTTYKVIVSDDCQTFTKIDSVRVIVIKPTADFRISSKTIMVDLPITFQNLTQNAVSYEWTFGDGNSSTLVHPNNTYTAPGNYDVMLIAEDNKGCIDTAIKSITILDEVYLYVPNSFTPDEDRFNNYFFAQSIGVTEMNIRIFNRWGFIVFESNDVHFRWDGTDKRDNLVKTDVYTYIITYSTLYDINLVKKGHVVILK